MENIKTDTPAEYDNIFTYLFSFVVVIFTFIYENFAYLFGVMLIMFGVLVYINMTKVDLNSQPMSKSKTVVIEGMIHSDKHKDKDVNNSDDESSSLMPAATAAAAAPLANTLLTPPIDLEKKLKSGFCKMHASKNSSMTDLDNECGAFGKTSCLNTDCCGWAVTSDNPGGKCHAGDKGGIIFKYDDAGKKIDVDCYYYKGGAGIGSKCS